MFYAIITVLVRAHFPVNSANNGLVLCLRSRIWAHSWSQSYSQNYIIFNIFKINISIANSFTRSIQWQSYLIAFSTCSAVNRWAISCFSYYFVFCLNESSLQHCVSDIATLWNKGELHLFRHLRFNYCCAEKIYVTLIHTSGRLWPYTIFTKNEYKNRHSFIILWFFSCYILYNELIEEY